MKVIPSVIDSFEVVSNNKNITLKINESFEVNYLATEDSNNDILQDLVESKAFATALLFLNENYILASNLTNIEDYYNDCNDLLKKNITVVEEKGVPLTSIRGYNIYESDKGILRGNGEKKILESFKKEEPEKLEEDGESTEGTQVGDIAPKVDQEMNNKRKKKQNKKYYDILLSGIDESMDSILNKGFMKNVNGQYERDGYILIKENDKFIAIRKDKLEED